MKATKTEDKAWKMVQCLRVHIAFADLSSVPFTHVESCL